MIDLAFENILRHLWTLNVSLIFGLYLVSSMKWISLRTAKRLAILLLSLLPLTTVLVLHLLLDGSNTFTLSTIVAGLTIPSVLFSISILRFSD